MIGLRETPCEERCTIAPLDLEPLRTDNRAAPPAPPQPQPGEARPVPPICAVCSQPRDGARHWDTNVTAAHAYVPADMTWREPSAPPTPSEGEGRAEQDYALDSPRSNPAREFAARGFKRINCCNSAARVHQLEEALRGLTTHHGEVSSNECAPYRAARAALEGRERNERA
jgi:hypothetical protein